MTESIIDPMKASMVCIGSVKIGVVCRWQKSARKPSRPVGGPTFNQKPDPHNQDGGNSETPSQGLTVAGHGSSYMSLPLLPAGLSALIYGPFAFQLILQILMLTGKPGQGLMTLLLLPPVKAATQVLSIVHFLSTSCPALEC